MTITRALILAAVFTASVSVQAAAADDRAALLGRWRHSSGIVIEFRRVADDLHGVIVDAPPSERAKGYRIGDTLIRRVKANGHALEFDSTVRTESAKYASICEPAAVRFKGRILEDHATIEGTISGHTYKVIQHEQGPASCVSLPGLDPKPSKYTRIDDVSPVSLRFLRPGQRPSGAARTGGSDITDFVYREPFYVYASFEVDAGVAEPGTRQVTLVLRDGSRETTTPVTVVRVSAGLYVGGPFALVKPPAR